MTFRKVDSPRPSVPSAKVAATTTRPEAPAAPTRKPLKRDEFSTGMGRALRINALGGRLATAAAVMGHGIAAPPAPPRSPAAAAQADVQKVKDAAKRSPKEGAAQLEALLAANPDPAYRAALLSGSKDTLTDLGKTLAFGKTSDADMQATLTSLANAAAMTAPDPTVGQALLKDVPLLGVVSFDDKPFPEGPLAKGLSTLLLSGAPGSADLLTGMMSGAKGMAKADLLQVVAFVGIVALPAFDKARQRVDQLNGELQKLVAGFGPGADPQEVQDAVTAFKARHQKEYDELDKAGAALTPLLQAAPELLKQKGLPLDTALALLGVMKKSAQILQTPAGQAALTSGMQAQVDGKPSFLDGLVDFAQGLDDKGELAASLTTLVTQSIASGAAALVASGDIAGANALIDDLSRNAKLFGVDAKQLEELQGTFKDVLAGKEGALEELQKSLDGGIDGGAPFLPKLFKGLGLALRVIALPGEFSDLSSQQVQDQIKVAADTLGLGSDGAQFVLNALGKDLPAAEALFEKIGGVSTVVVSLVQTIDAAQALEQGHYGDAAVDGLNAISGVLLLIPGAQVFGAAAAIASFALDQILADRKAQKAEHASEKDARQFLIDIGLDPEFAGVLANVNGNHDNIGVFLQSVAGELGLTERQLFEKLNGSTGKDRKDLLQFLKVIEVAGEIADFPVFGPLPTLADLAGLPSFVDKDKLLAQITAAREKAVQQAVEVLKPLL